MKKEYWKMKLAMEATEHILEELPSIYCIANVNL